MDRLFEPTEINGLVLKNRFVRSATWEGLASEDGACTPELIALYRRLAEGDIGLIITGHSYVHPAGKHAPRQLGIDREELIAGFQDLTRCVHERGGKIIMQLSYGGSYLSKRRVEKMTLRDIQEVVQAFASAATRARKAEFDGVQVLAAHGFFLSQLLCPRYNSRPDAYGGDLDNRFRALGEVVSAIREQAGREYPLLVKLNSRDRVEGGLTLEESLQVGKKLEALGVDAIELSGGLLNIAHLLDHPIDSAEKEAFFREEAQAFKKCIRLPLLLVGGIRSLPVAQKLVAEGTADYLSLCRPFIREPDLIKRWQAGDSQRAACLSCNNCVEQIKRGRGPTCLPLEPKEVENFFPQMTEFLPASPPHPPGTGYQIAVGLERWEGGFLPVAKIQMVRQGKVLDQSPSFPLGTEDSEKVARALADLLKRHSEFLLPDQEEPSRSS